MEVRLQKIISEAGIASRRKAEELILDGKVKVNNKVITELGYKADPDKDTVKVDGVAVRKDVDKVYIVLHKPVGVISSRKDEKDRTTVIDLIPIKKYIYPVGRLDFDSSGLILLTNDGDVTNALLHPSFEIPKTYIVMINGIFSNNALEKFQNGIRLDDGMTSPAKVKILGIEKNSTKLEVIITEGKNRQIRRMFDFLEYEVIRLKRTRIGNIGLGDLEIGKYRYLNMNEINWIKGIKKA
ncbi:MAG: rRNA pseudouridine synthase [Candidatus Sericytochromatia bacterium]|nr:rRNA pseudouridine synthase [Candidatus Sericytochromatia bacterium]